MVAFPYLLSDHQTWLAGKSTIEFDDFPLTHPFIWEFQLLECGRNDTLHGGERLEIWSETDGNPSIIPWQKSISWIEQPIYYVIIYYLELCIYKINCTKYYDIVGLVKHVCRSQTLYPTSPNALTVDSKREWSTGGFVLTTHVWWYNPIRHLRNHGFL